MMVSRQGQRSVWPLIFANNAANSVAFPPSERGRHSVAYFRSSILPPASSSVYASLWLLTESQARLEAGMKSLLLFRRALSHPLQCAGLSRRSLTSNLSNRRCGGKAYLKRVTDRGIISGAPGRESNSWLQIFRYGQERVTATAILADRIRMRSSMRLVSSDRIHEDKSQNSTAELRHRLRRDFRQETRSIASLVLDRPGSRTKYEDHGGLTTTHACFSGAKSRTVPTRVFVT